MRNVVMTLLAAFVISGAAAAQDYLILDPPVFPLHAADDQPVSARIQSRNCAASEIAVVRNGSVIELRFTQGGCPVLPPITNFSLPLGVLPAGTYDMRLLEVSDAAHPLLVDEAVFTVDAAACATNPNLPGVSAGQGLCIDHRFFVTAEWTAPDGAHGLGHPLHLTDASGAFWFFDDGNLELMVKVLDACGYNQREWFFAAGLTNVGVVLRVWDSRTATQRTYTNALGHVFAPVTDVNAFGGCLVS